MQSKLTLTVDQSVIEKAKIYAKKNKRSLSNIIEEYLKSLVSPKNQTGDINDLILKLKGSVKDPDPSHSYKEMLTEELIKKHL